LKPEAQACIYRQGAVRGSELAGVSLGNGHPFIHAAPANHIAAPGCGITVKG